jgi:hypothetical protein
MARDYWAVKIADLGGSRLLESRTLAAGYQLPDEP